MQTKKLLKKIGTNTACSGRKGAGPWSVHVRLNRCGEDGENVSELIYESFRKTEDEAYELLNILTMYVIETMCEDEERISSDVFVTRDTDGRKYSLYPDEYDYDRYYTVSVKQG